MTEMVSIPAILPTATRNSPACQGNRILFEQFSVPAGVLPIMLYLELPLSVPFLAESSTSGALELVGETGTGMREAMSGR